VGKDRGVRGVGVSRGWGANPAITQLVWSKANIASMKEERDGVPTRNKDQWEGGRMRKITDPRLSSYSLHYRITEARLDGMQKGTDSSH